MARLKTSRDWLIVTALLLLIIASRFLRLNELQMNPDEVWSVWQTFGTFDQIIHWKPYDWPPLYYLTLGAWWRGTSLIPQSLRLLSMLTFFLGVAFTFKIGQRFGGLAVGVGSMLVYAALGYNILLSIEVRGYALLLGLMPLALWLLILYFEKNRPRYGIALGLTLAAMFYISYTSTFAIVMLGVYSLIVYSKKFLRWWLPGGITVALVLYEILEIQKTALRRVSATSQLDSLPLMEALYDLFHNWTGNLFILWIVLIVAASLLLIYYQRFNRKTVALLIWVVVMPVGLYFANSILGFFSARYAWWVMLDIALWIGWGFAYLPRLTRPLAYGFLIIALFLPLPMDRYSIWGNRVSPLGDNFQRLSTSMQFGDLIIADPDNGCGNAEEWDYYTRIYFPNGIQFSSEPSSHRRVWYIFQGDRQDVDLNQTISTGRILRHQFGPLRCLFHLYETPPLSEGVRFDNGLIFHGSDIVNAAGEILPEYAAFHEGETLKLRLWWSVDQQLDQPYMIGTYIGQRDGRGGSTEAFPILTYPAGNTQSIDQWQTGQYYIEEREILLRRQLGSDRYSVFLAVIDPNTGENIGAAGLNENNLLRINRFTIKSY